LTRSIIETLHFYNVLNNYKLRKIATFRTIFPCQRHNRYFNFASVGGKQKTVASHPKRRGFCSSGPAGAYFKLGFFLSCQII